MSGFGYARCILSARHVYPGKALLGMRCACFEDVRSLVHAPRCSGACSLAHSSNCASGLYTPGRCTRVGDARTP